MIDHSDFEAISISIKKIIEDDGYHFDKHKNVLILNVKLFLSKEVS